MYSCDDDTNSFFNPYADIDYEELATTENDSIVHFLSTHYYDEINDEIKFIDDGQTTMFSETDKLHELEVTENEIAYKLYVYISKVGLPAIDPDTQLPKESPTEVDSIFVNRKGIILQSNTLDDDDYLFDEADNTWWSLASTYGLSGFAPTPIKGWVKGFPYFKSGKNVTSNGPITYEDAGKGYIFIPSGLAYSSINYVVGQSTNSLFDQTLVFEVELLDLAQNTDHDNDGKASIDEDADGDGDITNDFSGDSTSLPDYLNSDVN